MRSNIETSNSRGFLDKAGAAISWVCAVHCLLMPLVLSFVPLLGISFLAHNGFEYVFVGLSISVALLSLLPAYFRQHGKIRTLLLFISGISFVILADVVFEDILFGKLAFVVLGAGLITISHFINRRLCLDCNSCNEEPNHSFL